MSLGWIDAILVQLAVADGCMDHPNYFEYACYVSGLGGDVYRWKRKTLKSTTAGARPA